ncbi:MAG TPA: response regulator transcription factor [Candidatus Polarisedimenticolaceae bacterium]|nr:response regulator transcription factor [Candidatus Polarisedimenticolaceae bacterium]
MESLPIARSRARLLVVEDEPDIGAVLEHALTREGHHVVVSSSGAEALERCRLEPPDLVLLDLTLPDMGGLEILKQLRQDAATARTRVIIVTARRDEVDRILGFELGADDYVLKPFSPRELVLRVRALLQRGERRAPDPQARSLQAGPLEIDLGSHTARVDGRALHLTVTEFRLLAALVQARGRVRSRESLLTDVWGYVSDVFSRTVDTHVRRLRRKLGPVAGWIVTVRGVGYRFQDPAEEGR